MAQHPGQVVRDDHVRHRAVHLTGHGGGQRVGDELARDRLAVRVVARLRERPRRVRRVRGGALLLLAVHARQRRGVVTRAVVVRVLATRTGDHVDQVHTERIRVHRHRVGQRRIGGQVADRPDERAVLRGLRRTGRHDDRPLVELGIGQHVRQIIDDDDARDVGASSPRNVTSTWYSTVSPGATFAAVGLDFSMVQAGAVEWTVKQPGSFAASVPATQASGGVSP